MNKPAAPNPVVVPRPTPSKPTQVPAPAETKPVPNADPKPKQGAKREFVPKEHLTQRPFRNLKSMLADGAYLEGAK